MSDNKRIPELDGLRGLAILLVIGLHYISNSAGGEFGSLLYRFKALFRLGWTGVDLFFVLSGFLIGGILMDSRGGVHYFKSFYSRRARRIFPVYYLWLVLYPITAFVVSRWRALPLQVDPSQIHRLPTYFIFLQPFSSLPAGTLGWFWLTVTWSLAVEEQFYLLVAPVIRFLSESALLRCLLLTIALCPFLRWFVYNRWPGSGFTYGLMPCRADSLAIGVLAAWVWRRPLGRAWLQAHVRQLYALFAVLMAAVPIFLKWFASPYTLFAALVQYQWFGLLYACLLLIVLLDTSGKIAGVMRWGFLRQMGRVSYCVYLIHLAVLGLCQDAILHFSRMSILGIRAAAVTALAAAVTFLVAKLSWIYFESPILYSRPLRVSAESELSIAKSI